MENVVKKAIKTGYGLGLLTLKEGKKVAGKVKKELQLTERESLKLARALVANSEKASKEMMKTAGKYFESAVVKSGLANKAEVKAVKKVVRKRVRRSVSKLKKETAIKKLKRKLRGK